MRHELLLSIDVEDGVLAGIHREEDLEKVIRIFGEVRFLDTADDDEDNHGGLIHDPEAAPEREDPAITAARLSMEQSANLARLRLLVEDAQAKVREAPRGTQSMNWVGFRDGLLRAINVLEGRG